MLKRRKRRAKEGKGVLVSERVIECERVTEASRERRILGTDLTGHGSSHRLKAVSSYACMVSGQLMPTSLPPHKDSILWFPSGPNTAMLSLVAPGST
ncbi:hypothetical protein RRG08_044159 [Elysia crispata]|uniref:Uncharacterized protein n=1 Tax=Elysia crispata TaxID=231223 RepID=A0AAE0XWH4_9GAST|nr:hypothetical protein RRG08_044159 [Elysia crispata]